MKKEKTQKRSKFFIVFSILLSLALIALAGLFIYQLMNMNILPETILIPLSVAIGLFSLIFIILLFFYTKHLLSKLFISLLVIALCVGTGMGNFYLYKTANAVQKITTKKPTGIKNTVSIITTASDGINNLEDLTNKKVAKLKTIDTNGSDEALKSVRKELGLGKKADVPFTVKEANSVQEAVTWLYKGKVDAIILNETYRQNVIEMEDFQDFDQKTQVIHQAIFYTKDTNEALAVSDITTTPFNILVSGNDTYGDVDELSRSDVNMVVTVNPMTSTVLLTSIPRDSYVMTVCDATDSCAYGGMDKLTHTGIHGVNVTKRTVENLLDIEINYTFRANFSSVVDIVNALGGIDVEVPEGMAVSKFYANSYVEGVHEGMNHLDGERALSFARERKAYLDGDNQRVRNQQTVLKAIFEKATSSKIITKYATLLDALSGAFETNLSADEITDLIKFQIQTMTDWNFENYQVSGYGDMLVCAESGMELSVIVPYEEAVTIAHDKIQAVLDGKSSDTVEDTFDATKEQGALSQEEIEAQINADLYGGGYVDYGYNYDYGYDTGVVDDTYYDPSLDYSGGEVDPGYGDGYYTEEVIPTE